MLYILKIQVCVKQYYYTQTDYQIILELNIAYILSHSILLFWEVSHKKRLLERRLGQQCLEAVEIGKIREQGSMDPPIVLDCLQDVRGEGWGYMLASRPMMAMYRKKGQTIDWCESWNHFFVKLGIWSSKSERGIGGLNSSMISSWVADHQCFYLMTFSKLLQLSSVLLIATSSMWNLYSNIPLCSMILVEQSN